MGRTILMRQYFTGHTSHLGLQPLVVTRFSKNHAPNSLDAVARGLEQVGKSLVGFALSWSYKRRILPFHHFGLFVREADIRKKAMR